jgi:predicted enzyme related to lactoylglutathione lyase
MERAVDFWCNALDYRLRDEEAGQTWTTLVPAGRQGTDIGLQLSETPPRERPRVHLDLYAEDAAEQSAQADRLVALGAERVDWDLYPPDADFIVLADTEGNRFCIVDMSYGND